VKFEDLPYDQKIALSLEVTRIAAERGKSSSFDRWWFFDTNCLVELLTLSEHGDAVARFLTGHDVLVTANQLQELRRAPNRLAALRGLLRTTRIYVAPDVIKFWETDFINFLNVDGVLFNSLGVYPLAPELLDLITGSGRAEFESACSQAEGNIHRRFRDVVSPDIGADIDERDLCMHIWNVANKLCQEWHQLALPIADCHSRNFPAFYTIFYVYYFRYVLDAHVQPELNDFVDLANCMAAPYCERFYCDGRFAHILRECVQGRTPPTAFYIIKKANREGKVSDELFQVQRRQRDRLSGGGPMLRGVVVGSLAQLRLDIVA
jgi:hypothetical protein